MHEFLAMYTVIMKISSAMISILIDIKGDNIDQCNFSNLIAIKDKRNSSNTKGNRQL